MLLSREKFTNCFIPFPHQEFMEGSSREEKTPFQPDIKATGPAMGMRCRLQTGRLWERKEPGARPRVRGCPLPRLRRGEQEVRSGVEAEGGSRPPLPSPWSFPAQTERGRTCEPGQRSPGALNEAAEQVTWADLAGAAAPAGPQGQSRKRRTQPEPQMSPESM